MGDLFAAKGSKVIEPVYAGQELPSTLALGVTTRRLLVFGMNVASGRPNRILYDIPDFAVANVQTQTGRTLGLKKLDLDIVLSNNAVLMLEVPREHVKKGLKLVEELVKVADVRTSEPSRIETPSTQTQQPGGVPGWHPVPGDETQQRYWNGNAWTHQVRWDGRTWVQTRVGTRGPA
jgi:hypothetical protein